MSRIEGVVLDWAGTTVDFGCLAPVGVFVELFRREGVPVTLAQARGPMGVHKRDHIAQMAYEPSIAALWQRAKGRAPSEADVDRLYAAAGPMQVAVLPDHCELIPGLTSAVAALRARGVAVGSCTGYTREMLDVVVATAADRGYRPDVAVAATEVSEGRPAPYLPWAVAERLKARSAAACVVVGDTVVDVQSGRNAGMWSVGVAATGNLVGLSLAELSALGPAEREQRVQRAREALYAAGAHLVVDSIAELPAALAHLEARRRAGDSP